MSLLIIKGQSKGWFKLVQKISKNEPVVWIGNKIENNSICLSHKEALTCKTRKIKLKNKTVLTKADLNLINENFTFLNDILNRNLINIDEIDYLRKRKFIIHSYKFWKNFLITFPINKVISRRTPHRFYDNIIYLICKLYKIKILFLDNTTEIYPKNKKLILSNFFSNNLYKRTINFERKKTKSFLGKEYFQIIKKKKLDLSPTYFKNKHNNNLNILIFIKLILPKFIIKFYLILKSFFTEGKEFKIQILNNKVKVANNLEILFHNYKKQLELKKFILLYKKYSNPFDKIKNNKYIYFSLNRDYEKTVCPDGKVFKDIEFIIDYAISFLPKNYYLYIKDHPSCFKIENATQINRNTDFLNRIISKSDKIKILNVNENQAKIINGSKGVISLNGTSSWESVLLGRPAAIFGTSWYEKCKLVYNISNENNFLKFINKTKKNSKLNRREIINFLEFVYQNSFSSDYLNLDDQKNEKNKINFLYNEIRKKKF